MHTSKRALTVAITLHFLVFHAVEAKSAVLLGEKDDNKALATNTVDTVSQNLIATEDLLYREQYAKKMVSFMNQSVDPCDDFYEYACGNWKNTIKRRHTNKRRNNLFEIHFELSDLVEGLIKNPEENLKLKYAEELRQVNVFYESCLQADLLPLRKSNEYLQVIRNITGFPAIDEEWQPNNFDWFNATAHLSVYGVESFLREDIIPIYPFRPYFKMPEFGFDMNVHSDNIKVNTSRGYILNEQRMRLYLSTYGAVEPKITEVVDSVFELWHAILKVTDEFEEKQEKCIELGDINYNITKNKWKKWKTYFDITWSGAYSEDEVGECPCAYFYMKLDEICQARKQAVANYLALKFLFHMDARLKDNELKKDYCNQKVIVYFEYLIDQLYMVNRDLTEEKREVTLMTQHIRAIFREKLEQLKWLDEPTREAALVKEAAIGLQIGRVEAAELMDELINEIRKIQIDHDNYEKNNLEMVKFQAYMKRYFGMNSERWDEEMKPIVFLTGMQVQAMFYQLELLIYVMAGVLNPPAYHKSLPLALKYGTLGYAIGHELTHAFDTIGAGINSKGEHSMWWTNTSFATFENLTKCFIDRFNGYEIPEIHRHIDGDNTKDENIADHGGLRYAFNAYQRHIKELKEEDDDADVSFSKLEQMPGLDIKPEQLFYLGFTQLFCADYQEENIWQELEDEHTHDKYRALGTLSNSPEFMEAYQCAAGSRMNPTDKKCKLW